MKTSVLAIVLASALAAVAQQPAPQTPPPAPGAQAQSAPSQAAPEIKDPAEYNAYVAAIQQTDPNAKISNLEAFLVQYPNSVMKTTALELLMNTYLQANNQAKVFDTAKRLLAVDSCNLRALALLTYLDRQNVAAGQNPQQNLSDLTQYSTKGLDCLKNAPKPAGMSDDDYSKLKKQVITIFNGGAGFAALQNKDYQHAQVYLRAAVEADSNDLQNVYGLAMSYLLATPPDTLNGLFFIARAAGLAPAGPSHDQIASYGQKTYKNYHGSEEGWNDVLATAKTTPLPPANFAITKYVPPTPAQQAHDIVNGKTSEQIKQLSLGEWELVLSAGDAADQEKVWSVIKGVSLQMEGLVVAASPTELQMAATEDNIEKKQADVTVTMGGTIPPRLMPKVGETLDFEGTPVDYISPVHPGTSPAPAAATSAAPATGSADSTTPQAAAQGTGTTAPAAADTGASASTPGASASTPPTFMLVMEKGALLKKAGAKPAAKPPVHRRPAAHKPPQ
jgi:hypothetical protein